ncbi:lytic transglycosylase domain-containing protein [Sphingomonas sp. AP4-R1]|uniref:lytic transglycosylase domain-containing protein n=1 Tax=Sphingomonas sp. AP4-R1 TaxID=2735134 RepID=UPI0014938FA1|nr:lytic transglycosylase domain-containing protein [Sphingomonas sp. AP4-R1]QJU59898.1 lytic transglycosylase domain-containing protein [Sphingomonas sp. AP4-R1]
MPVGQRWVEPVDGTRTTFAFVGLAAFFAATPGQATDCISSRGMIEAVRPCVAADASAPVDFVELPRSVSVRMPAATGRTTPSHAAAGRTTRTAPHAAIISDVAYRYRIDPRLLSAMVAAESAGRQDAVSNKGALGLMQVMPATARSMGVADPGALLADPALAIETGAAYLKTLQARLGNDVPLVVAAYNAGPGAVLKAGRRVPAFRETQAYVDKVMAGYAAGRAETLR